MACDSACDRCASLRAATLQLVGERGICGLSLECVGERCGLTGPQIADHYPAITDCLHDTYEEVSADILDEIADAFTHSSSWSDALKLAGRRFLARMVERPAEARLCFVEALRGDREMLLRREIARRRAIQLFVAEHRRRRYHEELPEIQHEMLIGAGFRIIAAYVADGRISELPELGDELAELAGIFEPVIA